MAPLKMFGLGSIALAVLVAGCTAPSGTPEPAAVGVAAVVGKDVAALYTSKPFVGGQDTPAHIWLEQPDGRLLFYHLNQDDVTKATGVMFVGDAFPGKFCKGSDVGVTDAEHAAGYVHFHKKSSPNWDAGHGGAPTYSADQDGYWLRHIGATSGSMTMMGQTMTVTKGQVFPLMPSDRIPACPAGSGMGGMGGMGGDGAMTLGQHMAMFYTSKPYVGGQETPAHLWFEQPDGRLLFLHFDHDDVARSNGLLFAGDAFPGKFCKGSDVGVTDAEHAAGYVHFHKKSSPNWDAGHGGAPTYAKEQDGYWLRHIGAQTMSMSMMGQTMAITKGEVFPLMPSDRIPAC